MDIQQYVYLISGEPHWYKIGSSKHPEIRLKQLQTGNRTHLKLRHVIKCECRPAKSVERKIRQFFPFVKYRGEWLNLSHEQINFIKSLKSDRQLFDSSYY